jgi:hypothetical protein
MVKMGKRKDTPKGNKILYCHERKGKITPRKEAKGTVIFVLCRLGMA